MCLLLAVQMSYPYPFHISMHGEWHHTRISYVCPNCPRCSPRWSPRLCDVRVNVVCVRSVSHSVAQWPQLLSLAGWLLAVTSDQNNSCWLELPTTGSR